MKKVLGITLATAAAAAFTMAPVTSVFGADAQTANVKCFGSNACKGQSACKGNASPGKGQNACKGQGVSDTRDVVTCTNQGGKPVTQ